MKNKKLLVLFSVFITLSVLFILFLLRNNSSNSLKPETDLISVVKDGNELKVSRDGSVEYVTAQGTFTDLWSKEKADAFFNYFEQNYTGESETLYASSDQIVLVRGGVNYTYSSNGDELIDAAIEDSQTDDDDNGGNSGGGNDGVNQYFSPTPVPTYTSNYSPTPTPTPYSGGGGFSSDTCLFWRLSYCVIPRTPTPVPTATGTPDPNANVIQVNNCGEYIDQGNTTPTIISNTVCIPDN